VPDERTAALERMAALHTDVTEVGGVAERAGVRELILSHYLPAEPDAITDAKWAERARQGSAGEPPQAATPSCPARPRPGRSQ
jgi:ribonuclease BN (tRNA processing enzyme)